MNYESSPVSTDDDYEDDTDTDNYDNE